MLAQPMELHGSQALLGAERSGSVWMWGRREGWAISKLAERSIGEITFMDCCCLDVVTQLCNPLRLLILIVRETYLVRKKFIS